MLVLIKLGLITYLLLLEALNFVLKKILDPIKTIYFAFFALLNFFLNLIKICLDLII
jgi:hypothetical protein